MTYASLPEVFSSIQRVIIQYKSPARFWLGPKLYVVIYKPRDIEAILTSPAALEKDDLYKFARPWLGEGLFTASLRKWRPHRKTILPAFNQKILDTFIDIFNEQSEILVKCLEKEVGKEEFDIFGYVSRCTLDSICGR